MEPYFAIGGMLLLHGAVSLLLGWLALHAKSLYALIVVAGIGVVMALTGGGWPLGQFLLTLLVVGVATVYGVAWIMSLRRGLKPRHFLLAAACAYGLSVAVASTMYPEPTVIVVTAVVLSVPIGGTAGLLLASIIPPLKRADR